MTRMIMAMGMSGDILSVMGTERPGAFRLVGEIDMSLAAMLRTEQEKGSELILDLPQVTFMDSNGLRCSSTWPRRTRSSSPDRRNR